MVGDIVGLEVRIPLVAAGARGLMRASTSTPGPTWAVGLSALLIGALALTLGLRRQAGPVRSSTLPCAASQALGPVWNDAVREQLRERFEELQEPYVPTTRRTMLRLADTYARDWARARQATCTLERRASPPAASQARCLDAHAASFSAWVELWTKPSISSSRLAEEGIDAVLSLPALDSCQALPVAPAVPTGLDALMALAAMGETAAVLAALPVLLDRPGLDPVSAAGAWALQGRAWAQRGAWPEAEAALERGHWLALEHHHDVQVFETALALAEVVAAQGRDPARAQRWWRFASAWATRHPLSAAGKAALLRSQARVLARLQLPAAALGLYEQTLLLQEQHHGPSDPALVADLQAAAAVAGQSASFALAERLHARALALLETHWGAAHPRVAQAELAFAQALSTAGPQGEQVALRILQRASEHRPGSASSIGGALLLGRLAMQHDDPVTAQRAYTQAVAELSRTPAAGRLSATWIEANLGLGGATLRAGDPEAAAVAFGAALDAQQAQEHPLEDQLSTRAMRAQAERAAGREAGSTTTWQAAIQDATRAFGAGDRRTAAVWLAWAEATLPDDPSAALGYAVQALEGDLESSARPLAWTTVGTAALALGLAREAVAALERAEAEAQAGGNFPPGHLASIRLALASAAWEDGQSARAWAMIEALEARGAPSAGSDPGPSAEDLAAWRARRARPASG